MPISKVVYGADTIIDITDTTATASDVLNNKYFYLSDGTKKQGTIAQGSEGIPVATKGTVSNHSISITPSVTNVGGIITGGTKTGTAVSVSASELVSGTKTITAAGTTDVKTYASASVAAGAVSVPAKTIGVTPSVSINTAGKVSVSVAGSSSVSPTVTSGWVTSGTAGTMTVSGSSSLQLSTQAAATITPTESVQTAVASQKYTTGAVTIAAIPSTYVGSGVVQRSVTDLSANGSVVSVPSGYYATAASKAIGAGSAKTPTKTITADPYVSFNETTAQFSAWVAESSSITPTVTAGYVSAGTAGTVSVNGTATYSLSVQAAKTVNPTESVQTAVASKLYTIGEVKVGAISSTYVGSSIARHSSADLTASGSTITAPSGYYAVAASKNVAAGAVSVRSETLGTIIGMGLDASAGKVNVTVSGSVSVVPIIASGWVTTGTSGTVTAVGSHSMQLPTAAASSYTPSASTQTIPSGVFLTGVQTINPIPIGVDNHRLILPEGLIGV